MNRIFFFGKASPKKAKEADLIYFFSENFKEHPYAQAASQNRTLSHQLIQRKNKEGTSYQQSGLTLQKKNEIELKKKNFKNPVSMQIKFFAEMQLMIF